MAGNVHHEGAEHMIRSYSGFTLYKQTPAIKEISEHLSEQNKNEIRLVYGQDVSFYSALLDQSSMTEEGIILMADGKPKGIGGIMKDRSVWLVVADDLTLADHISFLKNGAKWFRKQTAKYGTLHGWCWSKNLLSMKWIRWIGFEFADITSAATKTINDEVFLYFQKTR